ncbi:nuclear transport factor 2 family protein [Nucisporomicrobium flavum]|uniref:nuclear transport factor 2 family protein n=1 Tax=Nucisporomicrobium flavum TaxID=2785915 RepID=UPI003C305C6C
MTTLTDLGPAERLAVLQTPARYAHALDQHDLAALADVLTEDATWTFTIAGAPGPGPVSGRAAILDFVRDATAAQAGVRRHHLTTVVAGRADVGTATVYASLMLTSAAGGRVNVITTGRYTFTLRRAGGQWRIAELLLAMDDA